MVEQSSNVLFNEVSKAIFKIKIRQPCPEIFELYNRKTSHKNLTNFCPKLINFADRI
jgi:hypothetical protein